MKSKKPDAVCAGLFAVGYTCDIMTLTIDLSPTEQARLTAAAMQTGLEPAAFAKKLMSEHLPPFQNEADVSNVSPADGREQVRIAMIKAAQGSLAHVKVSVEDLHRERQTDKQRELSNSRDRL